MTSPKSGSSGSQGCLSPGAQGTPAAWRIWAASPEEVVAKHAALADRCPPPQIFVRGTFLDTDTTVSQVAGAVRVRAASAPPLDVNHEHAQPAQADRLTCMMQAMVQQGAAPAEALAMFAWEPGAEGRAAESSMLRHSGTRPCKGARARMRRRAQRLQEQGLQEEPPGGSGPPVPVTVEAPRPSATQRRED
mmetsp:Transcript_85088/g.245723  ORF Transcript_85088/g.245723 Transcript_85088/m.245723 type:complete len:191 (+) Transcript_85088:58-630(+)